LAALRPSGRQERALAGHQNHATIVGMRLAIIAMRVAEVLFFTGLAGSAVVVIISFIEDWKQLFEKD
jgi:hypothetical protein